MKKRLLIVLLTLIFLIALPLNLFAATATDAVQGGVNKILTKLRNADFRQQSKEEQIEGIRGIIDDIFDWTELSKRTLGRNWRKFNPEQQKEFTDLFARLLQNVYADRLLAYSDEKIVFEKETELKKGRVEVASHIRLSNGNQVPLNYRMIQKDGKWRVYDIVIEGVSMVKNYRSQFKKLLLNKKPEDLIETLKKKTA